MKYSRNFYQIKSNEEIFSIIKGEKSKIGYYNLPFQDISIIKKYCSSIKANYIVLIGVGGSSLGTKAIFEFLDPTFRYEKKLVFLDTSDPRKINNCLSKIDLLSSHFVVVSKSGKTIEVNAILKHIDNFVDISKKNSTVISESGSPLHKFALKNTIPFFEIRKNIGGRFSVFSPVGLIPLAMVGIKIEMLLSGCRKVHDDFFSQGNYYKNIFEKARFIVENKSRFSINTLFSYSSFLEGFNKWYVQLWAESLGKKNVNQTRQGLTPIGLTGPEDQHSFLQLICDGVRNKTITFITIDQDESDKQKIKLKDKFSDLNSISPYDVDLEVLLKLQSIATMESLLTQDDIPIDMIKIPTIDEYNIAKLMYSFQLLTSCIGAFLQINTYDQPGVEHGKKILFSKLKNNNEKFV